MAGLPCTELQSCPTEFLDVISMTLDEFPSFVSPFETAFQAPMIAWRLDGQLWTVGQFPFYKTCPLLTPEDRLLCILVEVQTSAFQGVQGRVFGMVQGKVHQWMHVLLPSFLAALRVLGHALARSLAALAQRLGVSEADAATGVAPLALTIVPPVPLWP